MKNLGFLLAFIVIVFMSGWWISQQGLPDFKAMINSEFKPTEEAKPPVRAVRRKTSYLGRIRAARELMVHDYYSLASIELAQAIREKPDFIEPYLLLGEVYLRTKDTTKLANLLGELNTKFPQNPEVLTLQTRQWVNEKKFTETLGLMNELPAIPARLRLYQAILLALQNNHEQARDILKELQKVDVKSKDFVIANYGIVEAEGEGEEDFLRAEEAQKVHDLMVVYEEFDELAEGKNAHLFAEIAQALAQNNEAFLAREFADISIKEEITYIDAWILRGYSQLLMQDYEPALADLRHAYELDPIRPEVHYFLALALYESEKYEESALFFEKALEYQFDFSEEVRWKLLEIFTRQKKYDQVIELYKELLDYDTEPAQFTSAVHTAINLMQTPEVALDFTQILIDKNPQDLFAMNMHAWALIANEQLDEAGALLGQAKTLDAQNPRTYLNLGLLAETKEDSKTAKDQYQLAYEYGQERNGQDAVVNLAVDKYNAIIDAEISAQTATSQ